MQKIWVRALGVVCVAATFGGCAKYETDTGGPRGLFSGRLRVSVLAYNAFLRPHLVGLSDKKAERFEAIVQAASSHDIVGLSEVFDDKLRAQLRTMLLSSHPHTVGPPTDPLGIREDGGVLLMSRYPIQFSKTLVYRAAKGADALAAKGMIYARLAVGKQPLDVVITHTQSGLAYGETRLRQFEELRRFASQWENPGTPQIVMGDLNVVEALTHEYESMLHILGGPWDVYRRLNNDPGFTWDGVENPLAGNSSRERIDYLLCRHCEGKEGWFKSSRVETFPLKAPSGKALFGSDHYGVSAHLDVPL